MNKLKIALILGATREGRQSEKVFEVLKSELSKQNIELTAVDLRELNLPMFDTAENVLAHEGVKFLLEVYKNTDGFFIVAPEYNHSVPSVLKNAIDFALEKELFLKPMSGIGVSSGQFGGVRMLEQLANVWLGVGGIALPKYLPTARVGEFEVENPPKEWMISLEKFLATNLEVMRKLA
jgi:NAD(P)H-dependent FMN reductase